MPRLAANLSVLFTEWPFLDRFEQAALAGFRAVEARFPYDVADLADVRSALADTGLQLVLINLPGGNWDAGERGIACLPGREDEFRQGVGKTVEWALELGVERINCLVGISPPTGHRSVRETLIANLSHAADRLAENGLTLLVEALNGRDNPGYYLTRTRQVFEVLDDVGRANTKLLYDCYHQQISEGDLSGTVAANLDRIGHIQIACAPGRGEPGTGEVDIVWFLRHLDRIGYAGWVGCEYVPTADTLSSLAWAAEWLG